METVNNDKFVDYVVELLKKWLNASLGNFMSDI